jgi:hypothetical protein
MGDSSFRRHGLHNGAFCKESKMPWQECNPMDERLKFIAGLLDGLTRDAAQRYRPSLRAYQGLPDIDYPFHDRAATVTTCGRICFYRQKINLSQVFAGQSVGIKQTDERIWLVSFMDYDLGYFDDETCRLEPLANPFGPKVLPMSSV